MDKTTMKIYFAGSIRGGRDDKDLYLEIINKLGSFGTVLTEHVGDKNLTSAGESGISEEDIFRRDAEWLSGADAVVAEVTTASLGVGYELGIAEKLHKKTLCIYRAQEGKRLSAMVAGNPKFVVKMYKDPDELGPIFEEFFNG